jgi:hypothetical protein
MNRHRCRRLPTVSTMYQVKCNALTIPTEYPDPGRQASGAAQAVTYTAPAPAYAETQSISQPRAPARAPARQDACTHPMAREDVDGKRPYPF